MRILVALLWSCLILHGSNNLTQEQAVRLVENTPDFLRAKSLGRCPRAEVLWSDSASAVFQIRSQCRVGASGLIGNYTVDRHSAEVWVGVDRDQLVKSDRLRKLQERLRSRARTSK